jgi:nitrate/TMAO reductase-like tetraheme cytochrome c subunit
MNPVSLGLGITAVVCALLAGALLVAYLVKKPVIDLRMKLQLFIGLGVLPAVTGVSSTVVGMEATTERKFCGSCHVMQSHFQDASDPASQSLAARHSRNPFFGERSCYVCHADYGMYGYAMTKAGGMRHVYEYYLGGYNSMSLEQFNREIQLRKPYDNTNCRQCHSTTASVWTNVPDHVSLKAELDSNKVSCASAGCHGNAHPFNKPPAPPPKPGVAAKPKPEASVR